jgi:putative Holliday junction resolvase
LKSLTILALDFGEKKIGLAFKKRGEYTAKPIGNFKNQGDVMNRIISFLKENQVDTVVLGYPLRFGDEKSAITLKVEKFARTLKTCLPGKISLKLSDEKWTTKEAVEKMRARGKSPGFIEKNKDSYAAALILERFLEKNQDKLS